MEVAGSKAADKVGRWAMHQQIEEQMEGKTPKPSKNRGERHSSSMPQSGRKNG